MHDIRFIREHPDDFDRALARRGLAAESKRLIALDEERRKKILEFETAQARRNAASKEVGEAKKSKDEKKAASLMAEVTGLKETIPQLEAAAKTASQVLDGALAEIPNLPLDDVPDGKDANDNIEHHRFGAKRSYAFTPKQHFELGEALGQMDFETATKLSGARFVVLKQGLARLERALGQFMLDVHTGEHGYTEIAPPLLVRDETMFGTAQLPKFHDDQFAAFPEAILRSKFVRDLQTDREFVLGVVERSGLEQAKSIKIADVRLSYDPGRFWLIPTAEVPLTNLVRESIVEEA
jgi:seryl-tRNA synthetase